MELFLPDTEDDQQQSVNTKKYAQSQLIGLFRPRKIHPVDKFVAGHREQGNMQENIELFFQVRSQEFLAHIRINSKKHYCQKHETNITYPDEHYAPVKIFRKVLAQVSLTKRSQCQQTDRQEQPGCGNAESQVDQPEEAAPQFCDIPPGNQGKEKQ